MYQEIIQAIQERQEADRLRREAEGYAKIQENLKQLVRQQEYNLRVIEELYDLD